MTAHKYAGVPLSIRARNEALKRDNVLSAAFRTMPEAIKTYYVDRFEANAEAAFERLLSGASHVCPKCGHNAGARSHGSSGVYTCGCATPNFQALRMYFELAEAVGTQNNVVLNMFERLSVRDESELAARVAAGNRYLELQNDASLVPTQIGPKALSMLLQCIPQVPGLLEEALAKLQAIKGTDNGDGLPLLNGKPT